MVFPITEGSSYALLYDVRYNTLQERVYATSIQALYVAGISLLVGLIIAMLFASGIVRPLRKLTKT